MVTAPSPKKATKKKKVIAPNNGVKLGLKAHRMGIDTHQEPVVYLHENSAVCRAEGFENQVRVAVLYGKRIITARLNRVTSNLIDPGNAGFSEAAWRLLQPVEGKKVLFKPSPPLESFGLVRAKVFGKNLSRPEIESIVKDIISGRYGDVHLSAFLTACSGHHLNLEEITDLTLSMAKAGSQLSWEVPLVVDKHCVGGLPGNRTTPLVVAIVTSAGLVMPKTSSKAITSASGTADTMGVLTKVDLSLQKMQRVVEKTGGCLAWGGSADLSPADDVLIRVERELDLDSDSQMVASVLSKKLAAGSTHVLIDIPVGNTAKVRTHDHANKIGDILKTVGERIGLKVRVVTTDGSQPVGRGIGPALEAQDILEVLALEPSAPQDLRERAIFLSGAILEMGGAAKTGQGETLARHLLDSGQAMRQFKAICDAQGGLFQPQKANLYYAIKATHSGRVIHIHNRKIARVAKLAGAPEVANAGVYLQVHLGSKVKKGQDLFTVYAQSDGELLYALEYVKQNPDLLELAGL